MKEISSTHNATYKQLKQLATSAKERRRSGQTIIEGVHLCESYLQHIGAPLLYVYSYSASDNPEVARLMDRCDEHSVKSILLSDSHFRAISGVENGVGLLFVVATPTAGAPTRIGDRALLLENIQDPGNMGTILRTAAAAGVERVYTSRGSVSAWSPKVLRAGMGAHFALEILENCDLASLIRSSDVQVLATSLNASTSIYSTDLQRPTAWLFGNEGQGVSSELLEMDVTTVIIPQNPDVESLNVAAAVAVCLFEQKRQLGK